MPSLTQIFRGYFCKEKWFKRFLRLKARGQKKLTNDLDMLKVLKQQRRSMVQLWCVMTTAQKEMCGRLAERVLSEYSTPEEDMYNSETKKGPGPQISFRTDNDQDPNFDYIDELLADHSITNRQCFEFYKQVDLKRTWKWRTMNPKLAEMQSLKQLKFLIATNLCKPKTSAVHTEIDP